jgi:hypothetical protein
MENLETISKHYQELTEEEKEAAKWLEKHYYVLSVIKGLSLEERKAVYESIKRKDECSEDFKDFQKRWFEEHEVYVDERLIKNNSDHSHKTINGIINSEILSGDGENVRARICYALIHPENIEKPYNSEFSTLLAEVEAVCGLIL